MNRINSYDLDGVVIMSEPYIGLTPAVDDIIITGRSYTQKDETLKILRGRGINNFVYFNPMSRSDPLYCRGASGNWKSKVIESLLNMGIHVEMHFEDDPLQIERIEERVTKCKVVKIGNWT